MVLNWFAFAVFSVVVSAAGSKGWRSHLFQRRVLRSFDERRSFRHFSKSNLMMDAKSSRVFVLLLTDKRELSALDDGTINRDLGDVFPARNVVHDVEHDALEHGA